MDFYRILGINRDASQQDVKDAWRREALKNHPDRCTNILLVLIPGIFLNHALSSAKQPARSLIPRTLCGLLNASDSDRAEAARRFKEAKEAYEVLIDGTVNRTLCGTLILDKTSPCVHCLACTHNFNPEKYPGMQVQI